MVQASRYLHRLVVAMFLSFSLGGCVSKTPLTAARHPYVGCWVAADGTYVRIYLDGGGDFNASNSSVTGGAATFQDQTLKIALGPISQSFQISQPPQQQDDQWTLQLDGITYVKQAQQLCTQPQDDDDW